MSWLGTRLEEDKSILKEEYKSQLTCPSTEGGA
jgi:hypothetical protein